MVTILQSNVPRCPKCAGMMFDRKQDDKLYKICHDCLQPYQVINEGQAEIELTISDSKVEKEE